MFARNDTQLKVTNCSVQPAEPLWKRVPVRDERGHLLSDFMMIIPGLSRRSQAEINQRLEALERVLNLYNSAIVLADLNFRLNLLWISVRPVPGICLELPSAIKQVVPEALLVSQKWFNG